MEKDLKIHSLSCKTCLTKEKELFNLSEQCDFNDSLENILYKCCDVVIDIPGVKNLICVDCKHLLLTFYKFKEQCKKSESTLLSFVNINVVNIEKLLTKNSVAEIDSNRFELKVLSEDKLVTRIINEEIKNDPLELHALAQELHLKEESILGIDSNSTIEIDNYENYNSDIEGFMPLIPQIELNENCDEFNTFCSECSSLNCLCGPNNTSNSSIRKESIQCSECEAVFIDPAKLEWHLQSHHNRKEYFCIICKAVFYEESELLAHVAQHKADLYVRCHICMELFSREKGLQRHIERHHNNSVVNIKKSKKTKHVKPAKIGKRPPIACPVCKEQFLQYKLLAKHMKSHEVPVSFKCNERGKSFAKTDNMKEHKKEHAVQKLQV